MSVDKGRTYDITIEYTGLKKTETFRNVTFTLSSTGFLTVMDRDGNRILFCAQDCKVKEIAAYVIIITGYTAKPRHFTAYCVYNHG